MKASAAAQLYQRLGKPVPIDLARPDASKYNARRKMIDGILFASSGEARAYQILKLQERAGAIQKLELQPKYKLLPTLIVDGKTLRAVSYRPDFRFQRRGKTVCVDFKGKRTEAYVIRRKMFAAYYPEIVFEEWTAETLKTF